MLQVSATLAAAIENASGFLGRPALSLYLDTGTVTWSWDDGSTAHAFDIGKIYTGSALDPATVEVSLYSSAAITGSSTIEQAAMGAAAPFRGKRLALSLAVSTTAPGSPEYLTLFDGTITQVRANTVGVTLMATGALSSADERDGTMPIELQCPWVLYGPDCAASRHDENLTAAAGSTTTIVNVVSVGTAAVGDLVTMPSGETARLRAVATGVLTLDRPVTIPTAGQTVVLTWGCSKAFAGCVRHSNQAHFGGCPWRPVNAITSEG